jgi:multidrug efflux pump subunit AcrA (membrane-fusion protein)
VKLFARAGDTVRQGDPLFAVEASEFVQAQNDLISAVATLRTTRAQFTLAETNEKRQHALYSSQVLAGCRAEGLAAVAGRSVNGTGQLQQRADRAVGGAQPAAYPGAQRRRDHGARKRT